MENYPTPGWVCSLEKQALQRFTLSTTMSTTFIRNPEGPKGREMNSWKCNNQDLLETYKAKLIRIHDPTIEPPLIISINELKEKKAHDTWPEERFYLYVSVPNASQDKLRLYRGCSVCGKRSEMAEITKFTCINCKSPKAEYVSRAMLKAETVDSTGSYELCFFSKEVEIITKLSCEELWTIKDDTEAVNAKIEDIQKLIMRVEVAPTLALTTSRTLLWAVRSVHLE